MKSGIEKRLEQAVGDIWAKLARDQRRETLREIQKDPKRHKLTRIMGPKGSGYSYADGGRDHTGRRVWFCWASWKNAAGYFLAWKEMRGENGQGERVGWTAHRTRKAARAWSRRWRDEWKVEQRKTAAS